MLKKKMQNRQKQMVSYLLCACLFVGAGIFYCAGLTEQKEVVLVEQEQDTSLEEQTAQIKETEKEILVHVCGAVKNPGNFVTGLNCSILILRSFSVVISFMIGGWMIGTSDI